MKKKITATIFSVVNGTNAKSILHYYCLREK